MDERIRFVIRLKDGESMASLCREFGISRKTGYKIFERYDAPHSARATAKHGHIRVSAVMLDRPSHGFAK
jgi:transposase